MKKDEIIKLSKEERELEESISNGDYVRDSNLAARRKLLADAARDYSILNTTQQVSIRIKRADLVTVKAKAKRNGIPYQTLIGSIVHRYAENSKDF